MAVLLVAAVLGDDAWSYQVSTPFLPPSPSVSHFSPQVPVLGLSFRQGVAVGTIFMCLVNMVQSFRIILTSGVGKNGSTVAVSEPLCVRIVSPTPQKVFCLVHGDILSLSDKLVPNFYGC